MATICGGCKNDKVDMPSDFWKACSLSEKGNKSCMKAKSILDSMTSDTASMSEQQKNFFKLRVLRVNDRAYSGRIPFEEVKVLSEYYKKHGPDSLYLESEYLLGGAYRDAGDLPAAIYQYEKCITLADQVKALRKLPLYCSICMQQASLYNRLYLAQKSVKSLMKVVNNKDISANQLVDVYHNMATYYVNLNKMDSALYCYRKSLDLCPKSTNRYQILSYEILDLALSVNDTSYIKKLSAGIQTFDEEKNVRKGAIAKVWYTRGNYYRYINQLDSSKFFYEKALKDSDFKEKDNAAWQLMFISFSRGNYKDAERYAREAKVLTDSMYARTESDVAFQTDNLYNYQLQQKEKVEAEQSRSHWIIGFWITSVILLLVLGMVIYIYLQRKAKQLQIIREHEMKAQRYLQQIEQQQTELSKEKKLLGSLQKLLDDEKVSKDELQEEVNKHKDRVAELTSLLQEKKDAKQKAAEELYAVVEKLKDKKCGLSDENWERLKVAMNAMYPKLHERMVECSESLSLKDIQIIYLLCAKLSSKNVADLLGMSPQNLNGRKRRIFSKLMNGDGNEENINVQEVISSLTE